MKLIRYLTGVGNGTAVVPSGQILTISMVPGTNGSWVQINNGKPIWVPSSATFSLEALDIGLEPGETLECDQYPGDQSITIVFGQEVEGLNPRDTEGDEPLTWLVVYNGSSRPKPGRC